MSDALWSIERIAEWVGEHNETFAIWGERYSVIQTTEAVAVLLQMRDEYEQRIAALEAQLAEARAERWQPVDKLDWEQVPMPLAYDVWRHLVAQKFIPRDDGYSYALMRRKLTDTTPGEGSQ